MNLLSSLFPRGRQETTGRADQLTPAQARSLERECTAFLRRLRPQAPFDPCSFLQHIAYLAGGPIYTGELSQSWARLLASSSGGHTSALTVSQHDGWGMYINPYCNVPDILNLGHEAGHVLFKDVPKGDGGPPTDDRLELPPVDSPEAQRLLERSCARDGGFRELRESRAERFGSMLMAEIEGLGGQFAEQAGSLSSLFRASDV